MAIKVHYEKTAKLAPLKKSTVAIIGYGSQGHAHALNLKDSGVDVVVGLREDSRSIPRAKEHGMEVVSMAEAARLAGVTGSTIARRLSLGMTISQAIKYKKYSGCGGPGLKRKPYRSRRPACPIAF